MLVNGEQRAPGADIQNRAEVQKFVAFWIRATDEYRNRKRKPRPLAAFFHGCTLKAADLLAAA
jgi:hypothetical protein